MAIRPKGGESIIGSGFLCDGFFVTCLHVVDNQRDEGGKIVVDVELENHHILTCGVLHKNECSDHHRTEHDLCALLPLDTDDYLDGRYTLRPFYSFIGHDNHMYSLMFSNHYLLHRRCHIDVTHRPTYVLLSAEKYGSLTVAEDKVKVKFSDDKIANVRLLPILENKYYLVSIDKDIHSDVKDIVNKINSQKFIHYMRNLRPIPNLGDIEKTKSVKACGFPLSSLCSSMIFHGRVNNADVLGSDIRSGSAPDSKEYKELGRVYGDHTSFVAHDTNIDLGTSGGPLVFNESDYVVGILAIQCKSGPQYAVHVKHLISFLEEAKVKERDHQDDDWLLHRLPYLTPQSHVVDGCLIISSPSL